MTDPFGVEKSYVPPSRLAGLFGGKGASGYYKKAKDLTGDERSKIEGAHSRFMGHPVMPGPKRAGSSAGLKVHEEAHGAFTRAKRTKILQKPDDPVSRAASFPNGRGGGEIHMKGRGQGLTARGRKKETAKVLAHEQAHLRPRRNPVSSATRIYNDAEKFGREEGRADAMSGSKIYRGYGRRIGEPDFDKGYKHVHDRIAASRKRKRKS